LNREPKQHILIVGIDGASFNLIEPWLDGGMLPNFTQLAADGVRGDLESCLPPVTMPAWRVFSTGKYPGKLGVFWHQQLDPATRRVITPNATFFPGADYWDYLNQAGYRTGVVGMPDTYPPRPLDGFLVAAGPSAGTAEYAYPAGIAEEIETRVGFQPTMKGDIYHAEENHALVQEALDVINNTFAAAEYLADKYPVDTLQVTSFDINRLHHFFYDGEPSLRAWQLVDGWLGKLRPRFDYVLILSDHGTERLKRAYFLNVWLRQNGYLATRSHPMDILPRLGINRTNIGGLMQKLGLLKFFSYETLVKYASMLPRNNGAFGEFGNQEVVKRVDWARTRVFALAQGPLYINRDLVHGAGEYERLRAELIERIEALADPETGEPVVKKVYRREEIYHGPFADAAPDLLVLDHDAYHNRAGLAQASIFPDSWRWKGNNRHHGLFFIAGPGIKQGEWLAGVRIVDLAPTILHLAGVPVPEDLDGRVIQESLVPDSALARQPIRRQKPLGTDREQQSENEYEEIVGARLKALGYL
jgi:predicted AlkP superfamily phosphohydrolase/phosphomutase